MLFRSRRVLFRSEKSLARELPLVRHPFFTRLSGCTMSPAPELSCRERGAKFRASSCNSSRRCKTRGSNWRRARGGAKVRQYRGQGALMLISLARPRGSANGAHRPPTSALSRRPPGPDCANPRRGLAGAELSSLSGSFPAPPLSRRRTNEAHQSKGSSRDSVASRARTLRCSLGPIFTRAPLPPIDRSPARPRPIVRSHRSPRPGRPADRWRQERAHARRTSLIAGASRALAAGRLLVRRTVAPI